MQADPASGPSTDWVIRTAGDPARFASLVRAAVREAEPHAAISNLTTMGEQIEIQTSVSRFRTWLLGLFAGLAMLLASVGIYGAMSYCTAQRTQEVGVRMALDAHRSSILGMILRQGMALAAIGTRGWDDGRCGVDSRFPVYCSASPAARLCFRPYARLGSIR